MKRSGSILAALVHASVTNVSASDPIGVYAIVDRVVEEPGSGPAQRAQVWGAFTLARGIGIGDVYDPPVRGYFYFSLPVGSEELARAEWNDLRSVAGTGQCVAFASRYEPIGRVRPGCEAPADPDPYTATGLTAVRSDREYLPIQALVTMPAPVEPADGANVRPGEIALTVQNVSGKAHAGASYIFEIKSRGGEVETSATLAAGEGRTSWTPGLQVRAGERYEWRAQAAHDGWASAPAFSCFQSLFLRGDANRDAAVDIADAVSVLLHLFSGAPAPEPPAAGDADANDSLEISDGIYLLTYLFRGGPAPPAPFPAPGLTGR
jgi:hypothetical protein